MDIQAWSVGCLDGGWDCPGGLRTLHAAGRDRCPTELAPFPQATSHNTWSCLCKTSLSAKLCRGALVAPEGRSVLYWTQFTMSQIMPFSTAVIVVALHSGCRVTCTDGYNRVTLRYPGETQSFKEYVECGGACHKTPDTNICGCTKDCSCWSKHTNKTITH